MMGALQDPPAVYWIWLWLNGVHIILKIRNQPRQSWGFRFPPYNQTGAIRLLEIQVIPIFICMYIILKLIWSCVTQILGSAYLYIFLYLTFLSDLCWRNIRGKILVKYTTGAAQCWCRPVLYFIAWYCLYLRICLYYLNMFIHMGPKVSVKTYSEV